MSAKVLGAAEENVAEHLYKCSCLGLLLTLMALRDVMQGEAIARFHNVAQDDVALMQAMSCMWSICA